MRKDRRQKQEKDLKTLIGRVWKGVSHYRAKMEDLGLTPADIRTLDDLQRLPFTTKNDLRDTYPDGLLACEKHEIVRYHASSGTTGKPTVVAYTAEDLRLWSRAMASCLETAGIISRDVIQIAYGYRLFTGGLGLHAGAEEIQAAVIPASGGFLQRQILLMKDLKTTVLACTPSYALKLSEMLQSDSEELSLRIGIFGAEPWSEELRRTLEHRLAITALDIYGLSEIMGPGVAVECRCKKGLHLVDDLFLAEIMDPETGKPLPDGKEGELVITTLRKEALPMIRYRTRDITRIIPGDCECGSPRPRIARIRGRFDEMLIIRGVNVFPAQIETALGRVPGLSHHYYLEVTGSEGHRDLHVTAESLEFLSKEAIERLRYRAAGKIHGLLGIRTELHLLPPGSIERSEGKSQRIKTRI
ncbi:MAG: phenylacetate--CoA ligase family protein [Thermovirgaceae bacterium]